VSELFQFHSAEDALNSRVDEDWGNLTWVAGGELGNATGLTLGRVVIAAGHSNPRHMHPNCEEALYLINGNLAHSAGDQSVPMQPGDTITIPAGVFHNAASVGSVDADMIVCYSSEDRQIVFE
jgi:quercetin dioxygenase-like cupin family protein